MSSASPIELSHNALKGRGLSAKRAFHIGLLLSTIVPYLALGLQYAGYSGAGIAVAIIAFISAGHVPATFYLLTDGQIRRYVIEHRWTMIYLCLAVMALNFLVFLFLAANVGGSAPFVVYGTMLFYFIWQTWHFAKQNWGVFAFSCICDGRMPALREERWAIFGGGIAGVLGVYQATGQGLKSYYASDLLTWVDAGFSLLWYVGLTLLAASTACAFVALWKRRQELTLLNTALLLASTVFFVPYFFVGDALLAFVSFTWAHGLQYLLFLLAHGMSRQDIARGVAASRQRLLIVAGVLIFFVFCSILVRDLIVWATSFGTATAAMLNIQANYPMILNAVVAFLTGMTMVHFIWDARVWRLRDPEPRKWVRERFAFLFQR